MMGLFCETLVLMRYTLNFMEQNVMTPNTQAIQQQIEEYVDR